MSDTHPSRPTRPATAPRARLLVGALAGLVVCVLTLAAVVTTASSGSAEPGGRSAGDGDAGTATQRVVARPVTKAGEPAEGYTVTDSEESDGTATCYGYKRGPGHDVLSCSPSALYLPACFASVDHTVLCTRDARSTELVRVPYAGRLHLHGRSPGRAVVDLDLTDGQQCGVRVGGAWPQISTHPDWFGYFSCDHGSLYGPDEGDGSDGIDRSDDTWTLHWWKSGTKHRVRTREVETAYLVRTAA